MNEEKGNQKVFIRKGGWHYHISKECPMLISGDFERLGYFEVTLQEAKKRHLSKHNCMEMIRSPLLHPEPA